MYKYISSILRVSSNRFFMLKKSPPPPNYRITLTPSCGEHNNFVFPCMCAFEIVYVRPDLIILKPLFELII